MLFLSCGRAAAGSFLSGEKGFLGARTEMMAAAAEMTGSAPATEVLEKKVGLMKEVCSIPLVLSILPHLTWCFV
jgi:hypothetical protein